MTQAAIAAVYIRRLSLVCLLLVFFACSCYEVRFGLAELLLTSNSPYLLKAAARLAPSDAEVYRALLKDDSSQQEPQLQRLVAVAPYDAEAWRNLGLLKEMDGDDPAAEAMLQQAYRHDVRASTTWTLTNYYARHDNHDRYVEWGRRYLSSRPADTAAFFQLGLQVEPDVQRLGWDFPRLSCAQTATFAEALEAERLITDAVPEEAVAAQCASIDELPAIGRFTTQLLSADHPAEALRVWQVLAANPGFFIAPRPGNLLSNAEFRYQVTELGFDWSVNRSEGVEVRQDTQEHAIDFDFSGDEPEHATLLFQPVLLQPGLRYMVRWRLAGEEDTAASFHWRLVQLTTGKTVVPAEGRESAPDKDGVVQWTFTGPPETHTLVLALSYDRNLGAGTLGGRVRVDEIALTQQSTRPK